MFDWKRVPGHGHSDEEREWFRATAAETYRHFCARTVIVNIGVYRGCSMHCFRQGAPYAILYGIDVKKCNIFEPDILQATLIRADSTKYHKTWREYPSVHLLFIDGSHKPKDVIADIEGWGPKVPVGGIMALHDYERTEEEHAKRPVSCGPRQLIGVSQAVDEWWEREGVQEKWAEIPAAGSIRAFERIAEDE